MEFIKKVAKNYSLNMWWIFMFVAIWPIENFPAPRIAASLFGAFMLAIFQALFDNIY